MYGIGFWIHNVSINLSLRNALVIVNDNGKVKTKIYHKPPHTDQYLNWDSNHCPEHKRSIVRTLLCRAETIVSEPEDVKEEVKHVEKVLTVYGYKKRSFQIPNKKVKEENNQPEDPTAKKPQCASSTSLGCQNLQRVFRSHNAPSYQKPFNTIRSHW